MSRSAENNMLVLWNYGVDNEYFKRLLSKLNIKTCHYIYIDEGEIAKDSNSKSIYLYSGLDFYKNVNTKYELDDSIMLKFAKYERTAMEIVNRWHRSFVDSDTYPSIRETSLIFLRFWYDYIKKNNISILLIDVLPHIPAEFFPYAICKCLDIPVIIQGVLPLSANEKTTYILQPGVEEFDYNLHTRYMQAQDQFKDVEDYREIPLNPEFMRYFKQYNPTEKKDKRVIWYNTKDSAKDKLKKYLERGRIYVRRKDYAILIKKAKYLAKTRAETSSFLKRVEHMEEDADLNKSYYIFALHLQPEATTLPAGGVYNDQLLAIRLLSKCLPKHTLLYVKEHPSYWQQKGRLESVYESRNIDFYREIKKLKNVRLIDHKIPSKELVEKCVAVVTVTGTIGFEALFRGKPVLCFGETFYSQFPSVFRIHTYDDCKKAIGTISTTNYKFNPRDLAIYLYAVQKYAVPMGMYEKEFLDNGVPAIDDGDRKRLTDKIKEFYDEYYSTIQV